MQKRILQTITLFILAGLLFSAQGHPGQSAPVPISAQSSSQLIISAAQANLPALEAAPLTQAAPAQQTVMPVFRYSVVPGAVISGYFDHQSNSGIVHHYDGRNNAPGAGFYFQCPSVYMNDWVGCQDLVAGEAACANNREIWYDNHKGTDYEFAANWHTGDTCDPSRFYGVTMPIYAPASGRVFFAGTDPSRWANGWHIRMQHDLNRNGNYNDDQFRSVYLHFTAEQLAVYTGQIISEGTYLGLGGSTGYSSSPHLHFEVQRSADYFSTYWSVDPYGWQGPGADPWPHTNILLFRMPSPVEYTDFIYLPRISKQEPPCTECGELLRNNGFESGPTVWVESGSDIIVDTSYPTLPIYPHGGSWLAWLGGYNNASDSVKQTFTVPQGAKNATLRYYLHMTTEEYEDKAFDNFVVRLLTPGGSVVQEFEWLSNTFPDRNRWVKREFNFSLAGWQGQSLILQAKGMTDGSLRTSFYIDDFSLLVSD